MGEEAIAMALVAGGHPVGHEQLDRLADHLRELVTERPLDLQVGVHDPAPGIDRHDGVRPGLQHRAEAALALGKGAFPWPALGHVDDRREDLSAVGRLDRGETDLDRELGAVLAPAGEVQGMSPADPLGEEKLDRLAEDLGRLVPEDPLDLWVGVHDPALSIDRDHGIRRGLHRGVLGRESVHGGFGGACERGLA
jgi:hypothetical protein